MYLSKKGYARAGRVRLLGLSVVGRLSNACPEFFQPFGLILSMNDAAKEPERFGNIVAVEPDLLTGRLGILPHPLLGVRGLGELLVIVGIIVRAPGDLRDIKVAG